MKLINPILISSALIVAQSCQEKAPAPVAETPVAEVPQTPAEPLDELRDFKFHKTIGNIPYPATDLFQTVKKSQSAFDPALTNPVEKAAKYTGSTQKALNYGVYSMDLMYLAMFDRHSELKKYFATSRTMAKELDMSESFERYASESTLAALESNDSLVALVNSMYGEVDNYLRNNDRLNAASLILVGSWVESQYVSLSIVKGMPNAADYSAKVYEQKLTLLNLLNMLEEFKGDKALAPTIASLKALMKVYDGINSADEVAPKLNDIYNGTAAVRKQIAG
jgi:hypothetical protein